MLPELDWLNIPLNKLFNKFLFKIWEVLSKHK